MNYKISVQYDGTNYYGWAKQPNKQTIQEVIEKTFQQVFKLDGIKVIGSGRTDRYVHAYQQVCNVFHANLHYPSHIIQKAINAFLPSDIQIIDVKIVDDDFHAQYNAINKTYMYVINKETNLFERHYAYYDSRLKWDINRLEIIKQQFYGTHNFLSFSTSELTNTVREIQAIEIIETKKDVRIYITGNGFLKNMVRMVVASMLMYMNYERTEAEIIYLLNHPLKGSAQAILPGHGLYLMKVNY
ncbi:tRNA pseudouridine(38-40) synthase TruA [Ureaplasma sp. ES3154-GEN]|uniref:tRNA pseudouridine(38-40) synthase TruA n=1 Tax=Ureaplasma sp. ES3154-GEN TaxID=2984844 RepID=UPI0021E74A42|nr:tRNA pseudouridine(38-40) synthase TruA [Ureaplasma sp. ES3154-GEN]MCV3743340.1 tRNA pseudouridine(38-40) synthase TruA [Ureaplasma sp. ES3154-GEN]